MPVGMFWQIQSDIYALLIKREVKMTECWPRLFCVFMDRDEVELHKSAKIKERCQYPATLTELDYTKV